MKKILLIISIFIIAAACQSRMDINTILKNANGKTYHLTAPYKNTDITITISGNRFSGFAGVNTYFGTIEVINNQIMMKDIGRTRLAGQDKKMKIEEDFLKSLQASSKINITGKELRIGDLKFIEK